jgi:hypothetical protein
MKRTYVSSEFEPMVRRPNAALEAWKEELRKRTAAKREKLIRRRLRLPV